MKKFLLGSLLILSVSGCALIQKQTQQQAMDSGLSDQIKTCLTEQAVIKIQDGSVSAEPIRVTVKNIVDVCLAELVAPQNQTPALQLDLLNQAKDILTQQMNNN